MSSVMKIWWRISWRGLVVWVASLPILFLLGAAQAIVLHGSFGVSPESVQATGAVLGLLLGIPLSILTVFWAVRRGGVTLQETTKTQTAGSELKAAAIVLITLLSLVHTPAYAVIGPEQAMAISNEASELAQEVCGNEDAAKAMKTVLERELAMATLERQRGYNKYKVDLPEQLDAWEKASLRLRAFNMTSAICTKGGKKTGRIVVLEPGQTLLEKASNEELVAEVQKRFSLADRKVSETKAESLQIKKEIAELKRAKPLTEHREEVITVIGDTAEKVKDTGSAAYQRAKAWIISWK
jgi:hypothetical protein